MGSVTKDWVLFMVSCELLYIHGERMVERFITGTRGINRILRDKARGVRSTPSITRVIRHHRAPVEKQ